MKKSYFVLAALALALVACDKNNDGDPGKPSVAAVVNASISDVAATRASETSWAENDRIGITGIGTEYINTPYIRKDNAFIPEDAIIYFNTTDKITFHAYYPYNEDGGTLTATTGAEAQEKQPDIDFLFATGATGDTHNPNINFMDENAQGEEDPDKDHSFHHCMSQITLTFLGGTGVDLTVVKPAGYVLSGLKLEGSFDTATGVAASDGQAQAGDLPMTLPQTDGEIVSSVILFPQAVDAIELNVSYDDQTYNAMLDVPDGALESGNNYQYKVTINKEALVIESAEIGDWKPVYGGNVSAEL